MLSRTATVLQKMQKQHGRYNLKTSLTKTVAFEKARKFTAGTVDGETVQGTGAIRRRTATALQESLSGMETPAIWIWFPWRMNPEPPQPSMPRRRALKNVHGAVYTGLTTVQKKRHDEMYYGLKTPQSRDDRHTAKHPFLDAILKDLDGKPKGFPFWFKKYPTRRHAYVNRFNIPSEMLDGYSSDIKQALAAPMMTARERLQAQKSMYVERFAHHDLDTNSLPVRCVNLAIQCREFRNHLLENPHNNVWKMRLAATEHKLGLQLRILRRTNFKQYWSILRDHDVQDLVQPANDVKYRWGKYWRFDWNRGLAIKSNAVDFMDIRGLNGCVETGRSRAEVARDLGLSYTRSLTVVERRHLADEALYFEKVAKFKAEQPEKARERDRVQYLKRFTGLFAVMNRKAAVVDFPRIYRSVIGTKVLRWKSVRHGPM